MNSIENNLLQKARFLRNAAPQQFSDFFGAFAEHTEAVAELMLKADENLQLYQGHARQCGNILKILEEAKNG